MKTVEHKKLNVKRHKKGDCSSLKKRLGISYYSRSSNFLPDDIMMYLISHFKKAVFICHEYASGKIVKLPSRLRGNAVYAYRIGQRIDDAICNMMDMGGTILFVTLTGRYNINSSYDISQSFLRMKNALPKFIRCIKHNKEYSLGSYIYAYESHENGGAHVHTAIRYNDELEYEKDFYKDEKGVVKCKRDNSGNIVYRLKDKKHEKLIKETWIKKYNGTVDPNCIDIRVVRSKNALDYLAKEIGKQGNCEPALKRAMNGQASAKDIQKLYGLYFSLKHGIRRVGFSRDLKPPALDKYSTNSTEPDTDYIVYSVCIPKSIVNEKWFVPTFGVVEPGTYEFRVLNELLEEKRKIRRETEELIRALESL